MRKFRKLSATLVMIGVMMPLLHANGIVGLLLCAVILAALIQAPKPATYNRNVVGCGIFKELWENKVENNLYKNNEFLLESQDESEYVNNLTVHSPIAGDDPGIVVNRNSYPATATQRTDTTRDWSIDEYTSNPIRISNIEEVQLSYSKMESVLYASQMALNEVIANNALYKWAATGAGTLPNGGGTNSNILRAAGVLNNDIATAGANTLSYLNGTTGQRNLYGLYDIRAAKKFFDKQNIPAADRHMAISADALDQIISDIISTKYRDSTSVFDTKTGQVDTLMGFKFHVRSSVVTYNNAGTPVANAVGAMANATDNDAIMFWQKGALKRAKGAIKFFERINDPLWFGDLYSFLCRWGGTIARNSEQGVGAIVQQQPTVGGS